MTPGRRHRQENDAEQTYSSDDRETGARGRPGRTLWTSALRPAFEEIVPGGTGDVVMLKGRAAPTVGDG